MSSSRPIARAAARAAANCSASRNSVRLLRTDPRTAALRWSTTTTEPRPLADAIEEHLAALRHQLAGREPRDRRLADVVFSGDSDDLACRDLEACSGEHAGV